MTEREAAKKGFVVNLMITFVSIFVVALILHLVGTKAAISYAFGSAVSILLSQIFYLISSHLRLFGSAIILPVFGGFFIRMILLAASLFTARLFADLHWCAIGIIPTMLGTIAGEIILFARVNEWK
jgi:hypothetical protein